MADSTVSKLDDRLAEIARLDLDTLQAAWAGMFGRLPPKGLSRRLLELAAAYHAQAKVHGGLNPSVRRKLLKVAQAQQTSSLKMPRPDRQSTLSPGSRLVREWHGRCHTVEVTEDGFLYMGRRHRSLSEVARAITGTRWSGPRFFGL